MTRRTDPFEGEGEARALGRAVDWASTPLGSVDSWPGTLLDTVRTSLESPFPINLWCGPDLVLIYNDAYRAVLGAKHPAAFGRPGPQVWQEVWDDIGPLFERIRAGGPSAYFQDAPFLIRRESTDDDAGDFSTGDGAANAWFTFSLSPVRDRRGDIVAFLNIVTESTRRVLAERASDAARAEAERAEARLREVFAQAPAFLAVLRGPTHVFEYVNTAYYQLVGHRPLVGRSVLDALPEIQGQGFEELLNSVLETGEPFVGREVAVLLSPTPGSEPEQRYVDLVYYPITEADGTRSGVVAHGSDVTEHVLDRREAQRARAEAEHANRAKSQFLATMSHEIRTPINAVMGYADLLDAGVAGNLAADQQRYVDGIRASSKHLLGLISDILDLAKIEAGELTVDVDEFEVHPAMAWALQIVASQAESRGLSLVQAWECDDGIQVLGDEDRMRQILLNLLSNALKFTEPDGTITVRCRMGDSAPPEAALPEVGPWVVVDVEDTGRGIPPDQLARVFDPFVQAESGHTRRASGTGLGLTISRRLARLMGGELTATSEVGQGSRFSLWLAPAVQERATVAGGSAERPRTWPPQPHELPGLATAGQTLLDALEHVEDEWIERLHADRLVRAAERVSRAQLADQTAPLVAAMANTLSVLEEGGGDPGLLDDAQSIQTVIARHHGHQRRRLGWGRGELRREYEILGEVLDATLRREAPKRTAANLQTALAVLHRLVGRAAADSLAVYDGAGDQTP